MRRLCLLLCLCLAGPLWAQDPVAQARNAMEALDLARDAMEEAEKKRDRVAALTETVQAFEAGLSALREGLRQASIREEQLRLSLDARDLEIANLLARLMTIQPGRAPDAFLHPEGVLGSVRAGMLLSEVTTSLNRNAAILRRDLEDVEALVALQDEARARLQAGLKDVQQARIALSKAVADRTDLPQRFLTDPEREAQMVEAAQSLGAFAESLSSLAEADQNWSPPPLDPNAALDWPVRGVILRYPGEADAAGVTRPGVLLATRAGALVTSPTAATLRYVGPLLDMGNVVILEPQLGVLFVFAGLQIAYGKAGQILEAGAPLGLMGGLQPELSTNLPSTGGERAGVTRSETLYIEIRQNNVPQDPTTWFRSETDG